jgi:hypothetical protein
VTENLPVRRNSKIIAKYLGFRSIKYDPSSSAYLKNLKKMKNHQIRENKESKIKYKNQKSNFEN